MSNLEVEKRILEDSFWDYPKEEESDTDTGVLCLEWRKDGQVLESCSIRKENGKWYTEEWEKTKNMSQALGHVFDEFCSEIGKR